MYYLELSLASASTKESESFTTTWCSTNAFPNPNKMLGQASAYMMI